MYCDYYRLATEPFRPIPDPEFLFMSGDVRQAMAAMVFGIAHRAGGVRLTGEAGCGKTTLVWAYLDGLDERGIRPIHLFDPRVSFPELLGLILRELEEGQDDGGEERLLDRLKAHLLKLHRAGQTIVVILDDAERMPATTLARLRKLMALEAEGEKLLQLMLVGRPELETRLRDVGVMLPVAAHLAPLSRAEAVAYVKHRLDRVALDHRPVFKEAAIATVAEQARGVPRAMNRLCADALAAGAIARRWPIGPADIRRLGRSAEMRDTILPWRAVLPVAVAALAAAVLAVGAYALRDTIGHGVPVAEGLLPLPSGQEPQAAELPSWP